MGEMVYGGIITVGADGTILLPEMVRKRLDLHPSDELIFSTEGEAIIAMKLKDGEGRYPARETE